MTSEFFRSTSQTTKSLSDIIKIAQLSINEERV